ncbi:phosphonate ABC transporter, permease protein PhnE, partial [Enterococcus faecalis]
GAPLIFAMQTRNSSKVSILLIGVVLTIFVLHQVTELIRKKLR